MNGKLMIVQSCRYADADLGDVKITVNGSARHIVARWVGIELQVTIPSRLAVSELERFFKDGRDTLLAAKPAPKYALGQVIDAGEVDFSIVEASDARAGDLYMTMTEKTPSRKKQKNYYIHLSAKAAGQIDRANVQQYISKLIVNGAKDATVQFILPLAHRLADEVGQHPAGWMVKESKTRLGSCSSRGIITLSPRLIFLPAELRSYVIYHELSHLSEMNHSAAFHDICDRYCGGHDREYSHRLRRFRFPVI